MEDKFNQACEVIQNDEKLKTLAEEKEWTKHATRKIYLLKLLGYCSTKEPDQTLNNLTYEN